MAIPLETNEGVVTSVNIYKAVVEVEEDHVHGLTTPKEAARLMDEALSKRPEIRSMAKNYKQNSIQN